MASLTYLSFEGDFVCVVIVVKITNMGRNEKSKESLHVGVSICHLGILNCEALWFRCKNKNKN